MKYAQPADFDLVRSGKDYLECFHSEKYTSFNPASLTIFVDKLISKDKNFVVFIEIPPVFSRDSVYIDADLLPDLETGNKYESLQGYTDLISVGIPVRIFHWISAQSAINLPIMPEVPLMLIRYLLIL